MQDSKYISPALFSDGFHCPHCDVLVHQLWYQMHAEKINPDEGTPDLYEYIDLPVSETIYEPYLDDMNSSREYHLSSLVNVFISECDKCKKIIIWSREKILYPDCGVGLPPHTDLPDDIRNDFNEARAIFIRSPRGAAALLRLCIQKLCKHLGGSGKDINDDIRKFVNKGLDPRVQKALDVVRVIGNNAVHPGKIDLNDSPEQAKNLFELVNLITDIMISQPNHLQSVFDNLPDSNLKAIKERDKKK